MNMHHGYGDNEFPGYAYRFDIIMPCIYCSASLPALGLSKQGRMVLQNLGPYYPIPVCNRCVGVQDMGAEALINRLNATFRNVEFHHNFEAIPLISRRILRYVPRVAESAFQSGDLASIELSSLLDGLLEARGRIRTGMMAFSSSDALSGLTGTCQEDFFPVPAEWIGSLALTDCWHFMVHITSYGVLAFDLDSISREAQTGEFPGRGFDEFLVDGRIGVNEALGPVVPFLVVRRGLGPEASPVSLSDLRAPFEASGMLKVLQTDFRQDMSVAPPLSAYPLCNDDGTDVQFRGYPSVLAWSANPKDFFYSQQVFFDPRRKDVIVPLFPGFSLPPVGTATRDLTFPASQIWSDLVGSSIQRRIRHLRSAALSAPKAKFSHGPSQLRFEEVPLKAPPAGLGPKVVFPDPKPKVQPQSRESPLATGGRREGPATLWVAPPVSSGMHASPDSFLAIRASSPETLAQDLSATIFNVKFVDAIEESRLKGVSAGMVSRSHIEFRGDMIAAARGTISAPPWMDGASSSRRLEEVIQGSGPSTKAVEFCIRSFIQCAAQVICDKITLSEMAVRIFTEVWLPSIQIANVLQIIPMQGDSAVVFVASIPRPDACLVMSPVRPVSRGVAVWDWSIVHGQKPLAAALMAFSNLSLVGLPWVFGTLVSPAFVSSCFPEEFVPRQSRFDASQEGHEGVGKIVDGIKKMVGLHRGPPEFEDVPPDALQYLDERGAPNAHSHATVWVYENVGKRFPELVKGADFVMGELFPLHLRGMPSVYARVIVGSRLAFVSVLFGEDSKYFLMALLLGSQLEQMSGPRKSIETVLILQRTYEAKFPERVKALRRFWTFRFVRNLMIGQGWSAKLDHWKSETGIVDVGVSNDSLFMKLFAYSLIEYKRVVLLDSDLLVRGSGLHQLFRDEQRAPAAVLRLSEVSTVPGSSLNAADHFEKFMGARLNSGVMVLEPDSQTFSIVKMLLQGPSVLDHARVKYPGAADQELFSRAQLNWFALDPRYNFVLPRISEIHNDRFTLELQGPDPFKGRPERWLRFMDLVHRLHWEEGALPIPAVHFVGNRCSFERLRDPFNHTLWTDLSEMVERICIVSGSDLLSRGRAWAHPHTDVFHVWETGDLLISDRKDALARWCSSVGNLHLDLGMKENMLVPLVIWGRNWNVPCLQLFANTKARTPLAAVVEAYIGVLRAFKSMEQKLTPTPNVVRMLHDPEGLPHLCNIPEDPQKREATLLRLKSKSPIPPDQHVGLARNAYTVMGTLLLTEVPWKHLLPARAGRICLGFNSPAGCQNVKSQDDSMFGVIHCIRPDKVRTQDPERFFHVCQHPRCLSGTKRKCSHSFNPGTCDPAWANGLATW